MYERSFRHYRPGTGMASGQNLLKASVQEPHDSHIVSIRNRKSQRLRRKWINFCGGNDIGPVGIAWIVSRALDR